MGIKHLDNKLNILATVRPIMGGMVTLRFMRSSPDRAVWVQVLAGTLSCALGQNTLLSQCQTLHCRNWRN